MAEKSASLSAEERAAVKARAKELKLQATRDGQAQSRREAIDALTGDERAMADSARAMVGRGAPVMASRRPITGCRAGRTRTTR